MQTFLHPCYGTGTFLYVNTNGNDINLLLTWSDSFGKPCPNKVKKLGLLVIEHHVIMLGGGGGSEGEERGRVLDSKAQYNIAANIQLPDDEPGKPLSYSRVWVWSGRSRR